jgi:HAD superfamily hydrolase (TIGR01509 family)
VPPAVSAIVFDLYGTLVRITAPRVHKQVPRALGISPRPWVELIRSELLTTDFADVDRFVDFVAARLAPARSAAAEAQCRDLVAEELASVELLPGALSVLGFLRRRGYKLGLVSNLSAVHKEPLAQWDLLDCFDAVVFSCDVGLVKPDPRIYEEICTRLDVHPAAALMIGDSLKNDVLGARSSGMRGLQVGGREGRDCLSGVGDLCWTGLSSRGEPRPLVEEGMKVSIGGASVRLGRPVPLPFAEQGRYNMVSRVAAVPVTAAHDVADGGASKRPPGAVPVDARRLYIKRFLLPEAAQVEAFAREMFDELGVPSCPASLLGDAEEPCLLMAEAAGQKAGRTEDPEVAFEMGRQCAAGYLFSNADLRPRNAFLSYASGRPMLTMVDLEHVFFNLALDVRGLDDPLNPATIDALSSDEIERRLRRKVLSERTTRRAMRGFVEPEGPATPLAESFKAGWVETFARARERRDSMCGRIEERVYQRPYLIVGTRAYRRAMARIDVDDMRDRMDQDPEELFPRLAAFRRRRKQ